ncbi:hypothetical protein CH63R_01363 [Colletotrichum higginsianum IMI 349063]|uniref:Uncharacterized protein n=1 Tax=Colletotrichum higginsianum (strain IMI 349063) TaxID=759273 RepID=A0A1B7YVY1_COLHI|nr:hypothetical protein CH63R_01363 [Colletotrichum higginsianum IMI 349063]OBR16183.1 hypothetical protein CH63R_01363 [Colletotrichum higginsianum IMI 349063]
MLEAFVGLVSCQLSFLVPGFDLEDPQGSGPISTNYLVASAPFPYRWLKCSDRGTPRSIVVYSSGSKGQNILI